MGTVTDVNGGAVIGATVVLKDPDTIGSRSIVTPENGFFRFEDVKPGEQYEINISADGFADWTSPALTLAPGQFELLGGITLRLATQITTVTVTDDTVQIASQQIKAEETQRVLGIIPNFYVSYEGENTAPLTTKMKFQLAFKVSYDPVTVGALRSWRGSGRQRIVPSTSRERKDMGNGLAQLPPTVLPTS